MGILAKMKKRHFADGGRTYTPLANNADYFTYGSGPEHQFFSGDLPTAPVLKISDPVKPDGPATQGGGTNWGNVISGIGSLGQTVSLAGQVAQGAGYDNALTQGMVKYGDLASNPLKGAKEIVKGAKGSGTAAAGSGTGMASSAAPIAGDAALGSLGTIGTGAMFGTSGAGALGATGATAGLADLGTAGTGALFGTSGSAAAGAGAGSLGGSGLAGATDAAFGSGLGATAAGEGALGSAGAGTAGASAGAGTAATGGVGAAAGAALAALPIIVGLTNTINDTKEFNSPLYELQALEKQTHLDTSSLRPPGLPMDIRDALNASDQGLRDLAAQQIHSMLTTGKWLPVTPGLKPNPRTPGQKTVEHARGGALHGTLLKHFQSGGNQYVKGPGTGRSDEIPAKLSDGEYVMDAETVAMLGDGSSDAGAKKLDQLRENLRKHKGRTLAKGKFSPDAKQPAQYIGRK